eukprot:Seg251.3 transcript_id=Seg251.3/GoldUCD/mRNA.D3Y31 product="Myogenesis-regulating glycosidase" protein_id=Seg251.3/GoldUCD/D3Y31
MDGDSVVSGQTTQTTNTSDSSYPILFQLQSVAEVRNTRTDAALERPYARSKSTVENQMLKRVRISMALIGILGIVTVIFVLSFYLPDANLGRKSPKDRNTVSKITVDSMEFELSRGSFIVNNIFANTSVRIQTNLSNVRKAAFKIKQSGFSVTLTSGQTMLNLSSDGITNSTKCWNVEWSGNDYIQNCVDIGQGFWYGIGERFYQTWLLEQANIEMVPFTTFDIAQGKVNKSYGGVLEPYLISSLGFGILIDRNYPIDMSISNPNKGELCFKPSPSNLRNHGAGLEATTLQYKLCASANVLEVHELMMGRYFQKPLKTPDTTMVTLPVWSTWARYKSNITQEKVLEFANEIKIYGMPISQIEIDDKYSNFYGDFDFDPLKFKDPKKLITELHNMGMRVTIWVYPFANFVSKAIKEGTKYWVQSGKTPGIVQWWNGLGAVLDMTNPEGVEWFKQRLSAFKTNFGLDGFKFDAGEVRYLPEHYTFHQPIKNVNLFSNKYVQIASSFGGLSEVRVGYGNQNCSLFVRLLDRTSAWGIDNGLKSVLTATLTFGILGYPFVLPDMVGGNAYSSKPIKELYIRWTQLNVFLPSIQFSIAPWDYDNETVTIVKNALDIRKNISADLIRFVKIAAKKNYPIIRPVWWLAPQDQTALKEDSEFLVGDKYLVAPILEEGAKSRQVYLVRGTWKEMFQSGNIFNVTSQGKTIIYQVGLEDIIYFENLNAES